MASDCLVWNEASNRVEHCSGPVRSLLLGDDHFKQQNYTLGAEIKQEQEQLNFDKEVELQAEEDSEESQVIPADLCPFDFCQKYRQEINTLLDFTLIVLNILLLRKVLKS